MPMVSVSYQQYIGHVSCSGGRPIDKRKKLSWQTTIQLPNSCYNKGPTVSKPTND